MLFLQACLNVHKMMDVNSLKLKLIQLVGNCNDLKVLSELIHLLENSKKEVVIDEQQNSALADRLLERSANEMLSDTDLQNLQDSINDVFG